MLALSDAAGRCPCFGLAADSRWRTRRSRIRRCTAHLGSCMASPGMITHMPAVRRFAAGDGPVAAAIIRGLPDYFTDDVPAKVERDAVSHQAWVLTDSGTVAGIAVARPEITRCGGNPVDRHPRCPARPRARNQAARPRPELPGNRRNQPRGSQDPGPLVRLPPLRGHAGLLGAQRLRSCRHDRPAARLAAWQPSSNLRSRNPPNPMTSTPSQLQLTENYLVAEGGIR